MQGADQGTIGVIFLVDHVHQLLRVSYQEKNFRVYEGILCCISSSKLIIQPREQVPIFILLGVMVGGVRDKIDKIRSKIFDHGA